MPVDAYMAEIRARDIVKEEQIERESKMTKPFKTGAQLRRELYGNDNQIELTQVKVPKKKLPTGTPIVEREQCHAQLLPQRKTINLMD